MSSPMELVSEGAGAIVRNLVKFPGGEISGFAEACLGISVGAAILMIGSAIARSVQDAQNTEAQAGPISWKTTK